METYQKETRHAFEGVLDWLRQWACARSFGLGTRVPFDKSQLVESLSDSTIYMAYYTIAHLLQGGVVNGSQVGPLGIKAEDLTDDTWDYIFGRGDFPEDAKITLEQGERLRREYT
jgi:leucyl-tRNA synthetase